MRRSLCDRTQQHSHAHQSNTYTTHTETPNQNDIHIILCIAICCCSSMSALRVNYNKNNDNERREITNQKKYVKWAEKKCTHIFSRFRFMCVENGKCGLKGEIIK